MKRHHLGTRMAFILLAALTLGGGVLELATPPAAAVVPGANGRIVFQSNRDGDGRSTPSAQRANWASAVRKRRN